MFCRGLQLTLPSGGSTCLSAAVASASANGCLCGAYYRVLTARRTRTRARPPRLINRPRRAPVSVDVRRQHDPVARDCPTLLGGLLPCCAAQRSVPRCRRIARCARRRHLPGIAVGLATSRRSLLCSLRLSLAQ